MRTRRAANSRCRAIGRQHAGCRIVAVERNQRTMRRIDSEQERIVDRDTRLRRARGCGQGQDGVGRAAVHVDCKLARVQRARGAVASDAQVVERVANDLGLAPLELAPGDREIAVRVHAYGILEIAERHFETTVESIVPPPSS